MIAEIGHFAMVLALVIAIVQSTLPLYGAARRDAALMALARPAAQAQFLCLAIAFGALIGAFVTSDFTVALVARNSSSAKPMLYKVTGVWGNHEGSMLLWVLILSLFGASVASFGRNLPDGLRTRVLSIHGLIGVGFLLFILFTSNPFERLNPPPLDGSGFNPLLQDPGLAFHPPFLYLGYVGFSTAFAFAVAALIEGRVDAAWARWVRPWTLAAWSFLTIGIAMGSWWAYYELGWGGWWFWDPVENASFMPWLAGTALLHSAIVVEKRDTLKSWTILLAILTFSLSLIGTFLVRSGVLTSVHAFAQDPRRGVFILMLLVLAIGGSLALFALRAPRLRSAARFVPISREGALILNNLLLATACATVFLGTLYPLFLDAVGGPKVSVGPPYFDSTFLPLMVPVIIAMAVGPMLAWKRGDLPRAMRQLWLALIAALAVAGLSYWVAGGTGLLAAGGMALAAWLFAGALIEYGGRIKLFRAPLAESWSRARHLPRAAYGMTIAHAGVAILIAGITASSAWRTESIQIMRPNDSVDVAGYTFTFHGVTEEAGPNYRATRASITVSRNGHEVALLFPEKRFYPVERRETTEAAIHTTWFADLYAVISAPDKSGGWSTRFYHNPLVPWIWIGVIVMAFGGGLSLTDRRHRVGAPRRARRPAAKTAPA